jgi:hypothetical protein
MRSVDTGSSLKCYFSGFHLAHGYFVILSNLDSTGMKTPVSLSSDREVRTRWQKAAKVTRVENFHAKGLTRISHDANALNSLGQNHILEF